MTGSTNAEQVLGAGAAPTQTRRAALKKFGRYAAAAPTIMVLLEPRDGNSKTKDKKKDKKKKDKGSY